MTREQPDEIRAYYRDGAVVASYLQRRTAQPLNGALHDAQVRLLRRVIAERRPATVVEIAPGPARLTAEVSIPGAGLAVEFSEGMLATAQARLGADSAWRLVRGDAFALPVRDAQADFVFSLRFVRRFHLAERQRLYGEIRRVLRPGGALMLDAQNRAVALPHRVARGLESYPVYDQLYDRQELVAELEGAGFHVTRVEALIRHFAAQRLLNRLRRIGLHRIARTLIDSLEYVPGNNPSNWMILCERAS